MQVYSKKDSVKKQLKKETIQFLLAFSKSLKVVRTKSNAVVELNLN